MRIEPHARAERGSGRTRQIAVLAAALFAPSLALAQTTTRSEPEKAWAEVQQQAAEADNAQDCALACRALQSLARATQHLCDLGPEHCDEARAKLREATERVHALCPDCTVGTLAEPQPRAEMAGAPSSDRLVAESSSQKGGGCAGCSTTASSGDLVVLALASLALMAVRRKKRPRV
ncbi:MAG TPA: MYXO-CTERM sorting domain-containing protein [Polyangiaceae bacterium]|nr:MYXO-CTERM sorting domain-containing protein [Polyangiaceae bacterium]